MSTQKPSGGRIVRYVVEGGDNAGQERPAVIIAPCLERFPGAAYTRDECQLHVYFDGSNDLGPQASNPLSYWRNSVPYDESGALGTWHWPSRT